MEKVARAFWVTGPGQGEIRDTPLPARGKTDLLIRSAFSGISRGTEALVFAGRVPVSERQRMRAPFQDGDFPGPVKYGYANVGLVEEGPPELRGRHVFSLFPHQTEFVLPVHAAHLLPDDVPPARAVLAANVETAINGVWDGAPKPGDRVLVIGAGTVGCLVGWLVAAMPGVHCAVSDINLQRASVAAGLGVPFVQPDQLTADWNLIVHASGSEAGLLKALETAAPDGDDSRDELVRRSRDLASIGSGVSLTPTHPQVVAGRLVAAGQARRLDARASDSTMPSACSRRQRSMPSSPARADSRSCRQ